MAGPLFPDMVFDAHDVTATQGALGVYTLNFSHDGQSFGAITLSGFEVGSNSTLQLIGGHGSTFDIDLDALLNTATSVPVAALPAAPMGDRMDLFSSLLHDTLVHEPASDASPVSPGVDQAVHADLFANASEQALLSDASHTLQTPAA